MQLLKVGSLAKAVFRLSMTAMKSTGCAGWIFQNRVTSYTVLIGMDDFLIIKGEKIIPIPFAYILLLVFGLVPTPPP